MSLIPTITLEELSRKVKQGTVKGLPCSEITGENGDYVATLIVPCMGGGVTIFDHVRTQAEYLGVQGNSVYVEPEPERFICDICGKELEKRIALEGHKRSHKEV